MSRKYQAYPAYKESGVDWIGSIPSGWGVVRLDGVTRYIRDSKTPSWLEGKGVVHYSIPYVQEFGIGQLEDGGELDSSKLVVKEGDLLVSKLNPRKGTICVVQAHEENAVASTEFVALRSNAEDSQYLQYLFRSQELSSFICSQVESATRSHQRVNPATIYKLKAPLPGKEERRTIAAFLDHETAKIDRLIEKQQRLIELLKEKRQAVISHAVTKGPGETSAKLGYFVDLLPGYAFPSSGFEHSESGNVKLLRGTNVGVGKLRWEDVVYWPSSDLVKLKDFKLQTGDIVFGMDRPWISSGARVAEVTEADLPCLLLQRVARIRAHAEIYQPFVKMCLASHEFKSYVESDLTGVSVPHISPEQIKNFPIRVISFEEQKRITEEVNRKLEEFDKIELKASKAIRLMQERRTALISAAVTGKIDVRNWTPDKQSSKVDLPMVAEEIAEHQV